MRPESILVVKDAPTGIDIDTSLFVLSLFVFFVSCCYLEVHSLKVDMLVWYLGALVPETHLI